MAWRHSSPSRPSSTRNEGAVSRPFREISPMRYALPVLAYLVPTFAPGFVCHLVLCDGYYKALASHRPDIIIPCGFLSMIIQAAILAWIYEKPFAQQPGTLASRALAYGAVGAVLSWSF